MSIHTVTMYSAICDNCQEGFEANHTGYCAFVDKETCRDEMVNRETGWVEHEINGRKKHYCSKCHKFDSQDRLMINGNRKKEPPIYSRDECAEFASDAESKIHAAMDEYAKEVAIAFENWKKDNEWVKSESRYNKWYCETDGVEFEYISHDQLFDKFLQNKEC